ncbi:MAG TPA: VanZ family protein [Candidatus Acidoferrales bacterium]|uniref:VanZ-like domain-containing protein n=1 Tax=uncultured Acidobacteria bacterium Rifle_16ft_4_minimus_37967 TaxID=1665087 RepID=A0A0H4T6L4_9BACT|nr:hypothetical protein [uncultured Acidobacteria bacterium Rifle_16ft_4_minimus_37967]
MNPSPRERPSAFSGSSRWSHWWPAVLWAGIIALFSSNWFSSGHTWGYFIRFASYLFPGLSPEEIQVLHGVVRKLAHFLAYFILSLLLFRALRRGRSGWHRRWSLAALLVSGLYAGADELHQLFAAQRTGAFGDVGIDSLGALAAQLLLWLGRGEWALQINKIRSTARKETPLEK